MGMIKEIVDEMGSLQKEMNRRLQIERKAAVLEHQGKYDEVCKVLDTMNTVEDAEYLSKKGFRTILHNGAVTEWEFEHGQA